MGPVLRSSIEKKLTEVIFLMPYVHPILSSPDLTQNVFFVLFFQNPSQLLQVRILKVKKKFFSACLFLPLM